MAERPERPRRLPLPIRGCAIQLFCFFCVSLYFTINDLTDFREIFLGEECDIAQCNIVAQQCVRELLSEVKRCGGRPYDEIVQVVVRKIVPLAIMMISIVLYVWDLWHDCCRWFGGFLGDVKDEQWLRAHTLKLQMARPTIRFDLTVSDCWHEGKDDDRAELLLEKSAEFVVDSCTDATSPVDFVDHTQAVILRYQSQDDSIIDFDSSEEMNSSDSDWQLKGSRRELELSENDEGAAAKSPSTSFMRCSFPVQLASVDGSFEQAMERFFDVVGREIPVNWQRGKKREQLGFKKRMIVRLTDAEGNIVQKGDMDEDGRVWTSKSCAEAARCSFLVDPWSRFGWCTSCRERWDPTYCVVLRDGTEETMQQPWSAERPWWMCLPVYVLASLFFMSIPFRWLLFSNYNCLTYQPKCWITKHISGRLNEIYSDDSDSDCGTRCC
eukprot:TRINITY_DN20351_c0_g1_i1.p1 TRINITY_DN20351_c0_g1~~TRINITY_DN20351_c0_g1_i1.p1  ORF type:complete len:439 (-),score=54.32 TRINITY_DN20351_c0_g1_i1:322-1638(-)